MSVNRVLINKKEYISILYLFGFWYTPPYVKQLITLYPYTHQSLIILIIKEFAYILTYIEENGRGACMPPFVRLHLSAVSRVL